MKKIFFLILFGVVLINASAQYKGTTDLTGYRFQKRIKGPKHKKSKVLEIMVDDNNYYFAATFRAEKSKYVYIVVYTLYTWKPVGKYKIDDNRCELYNSYFDKEGKFFYVNYDIYKNRYKKINLKSGEVESVECTQTPKGCQKLEPHQYKVEAYTVGENYFIFRDSKFKNYLKIYVKKELYVPDIEDSDDRQNANVQKPVIKEAEPQITIDTTNINENIDSLNVNDTVNKE
ncbi:MAG: hypothetical protein DRJ01_02280 [Bacteroidetes bacterium]|nr:MAG: hypothetical protein DRJ01_02280 [Bacteroidota bacterium]